MLTTPPCLQLVPHEFLDSLPVGDLDISIIEKYDITLGGSQVLGGH